MLKHIMIPVAAFAVTATAASAFNTDMLEQIDIDLFDTQISALEEAHELKEAGAQRDEVKAILEAADIDRETMREIRTAVHEVRDETREAVRTAVAANDYDAFVAAAPERLLAAVESEADFVVFVEMQELRGAGDKEGAVELMEELGLEKPEHKGGRHGQHGGDREGKGPRA